MSKDYEWEQLWEMLTGLTPQQPYWKRTIFPIFKGIWSINTKEETMELYWYCILEKNEDGIPVRILIEPDVALADNEEEVKTKALLRWAAICNDVDGRVEVLVRPF